MEHIWEIITTVGVSAGTGLFTWLFNRSRYRAEVKQLKAELESSKIDNLSKAADGYEHIIDYIRRENERLTEELQQNRREIASMIEEQTKLKTKIMELTLEINKLNMELGKYRKPDKKK